jgi:predicted glutamine amidotransferase
MTAAASDGRKLYAFRYSSDGASPSLFFCVGQSFTDAHGRYRLTPGDGSLLVLSEPLDEAPESWREVPEGHMLTAEGGDVTLARFR